MDIFNLFGLTSKKYLIPPRALNAMSGSDFVNKYMEIVGPVREQAILNEFLAGNIPDFLRNFTAVEVTKNSDKLTYITMTDYLSIGSNQDYVRMSMNAITAQKIANQYDCSLPTKKMVNQIWQQSNNKLEPKPWGPPYDEDMFATHRIGTHNTTIQNQLIGKDPYELTSGQKKDIILTNALGIGNPKKKIGIYGWIQLNGVPIHNFNTHSHEITYEDYSHGVRLIANDVVLNGKPVRIKDIFSDRKWAPLISDEVPLTFLNY